jgi:transposase-like protein
MTKPYSLDLRDRVVAAVEKEGMSRNRAAARFGVAVSTAVHWVRRFRSTGSEDRRLQEKDAAGRARPVADRPVPRKGLHHQPAGGRAEGSPRSQGRPTFGVGVSARRGAELQKKACSPRSRIVATSPDGVSSGARIRGGSIPDAWCSSTRPGPRTTWPPCAAGDRAGPG